MNQLQFLSLRHEHDRMPWQLNLSIDDRTRYDRCRKTFTQSSLREWLQCSVEPWRLYGARKPDDMPGRNGDKRALAKLSGEQE